MEDKEEKRTDLEIKDQENVQESSELTAENSVPESDVSEEKEESSDGEQNQDEEHEDDPLAELHLENASKKEIYDALNAFSGTEDMRLLDRALKEIKPFFDKLYTEERDAALEQYLVEEGNDEADFRFKGDTLDSSFFLLYNTLRDKKQKFFAKLNKDREQNLTHREQLLDRIRELVDGEETNASMDEMKSLQAEWKSIGQVPAMHAKTLWANYNALLDRFYDNRSIYFELKELDRKKNLEQKLELCAKAEQLDQVDNIKDAIIQLNELHEEFKHIGPVPKEDQDPVWDRFKAASDKVYSKRKDFYDGLRSELNENADKKWELGNEAEVFASFDSDKISDWNKKTKQILELQKKWEALGGLPRDRAKDVNRHFWSNFKKFFANKGEFFKRLEAEREVNLEKKMALLKKAEELKESNDWNRTAGELKKLQQQWREVGPVPEKHRNDVYQKFKAACDAFFERKRSKNSGQNKEYDDNLKKKKEICNMLEAYLNSDEISLDEVYDLLDRYADIGFVPKESIDAIHKRFDSIMDTLLGLEDLSDEQRAELEIKIQVNRLKNSPHGAQKLNRKEQSIRRKISDLESDISTWKTNLDFFASSKMADQLKDEFTVKISEAEAEIESLKHQLDVFRKL